MTYFTKLVAFTTVLLNKQFDVQLRSLLNRTNDGELFTLDAIRSGIRFQRSVAEGWIKVRGVRR